MAEKLTSPAEADRLGVVLRSTVDILESEGFTRTQVGAAMIGVGSGVVMAHQGRARLLQVLEGTMKAAQNGDPERH